MWQKNIKNDEHIQNIQLHSKEVLTIKFARLFS